ncbi:hypothetical protein AWW66_26915 [Micromonospora rosaria]|uniref:Uncharacterized protein n=1 Tax=Micromonospora rosaria TaxID=47874 RepID=A0A136PKM8_9ACTN|nr:hypothetical protein [Micromonospora rosaria]KXK58953.1 hypothetical protein AWW66_26915 [Micromonospora rosaria]
MHVFPAEIPAAEARRADVVEVRVARKVAALFGLGSELPPFRRSWVCDFTELSLAEVGRGAPSPDRADRSRLESTPARSTGGDPPEWAWSGRAVWAPQQGTLPGALTNATLNRYGPDTKAAAVLAGANRLLQGPTEAVAEVCRYLAHTDCDAELRLAVWAGLVLEVYRAQPALVVAAIQARQVQRSLSARWGTQVDRAAVTAAGAPSEIHPPSDPDDASDPHESASRWQPTSFDLVDATLPAVGLADDPATGPGLLAPDTLDDIASAWCHRLVGVGRPGRGVVWLTEDSGGSRRVHAMVRVGAVVAPFVAATLGGTHRPERKHPPVLPTLPTVDVLADLPLLQRRAHLLVAHVAVNYLRYRDELLRDWPELRTRTRALVARAVRGCADVLAADDPVPLQLRAYDAYLEVWDPPRAGRADGTPGAADGTRPAASVRRLLDSQHAVVQAWRAGRLDPGAAAYLLEIGVVALRDADRAVDPAAVGSWWSASLEARGLDPRGDLAARVAALSDAQVFHLQHYAAWLARSGRRTDLRRALAVQERVVAVRVQVARREPAGFAAKSAAARDGHELAATIATDLALATPDRERRARTHALETAVRHAHAVLADPSISDLKRAKSPQPATGRIARVVARALTVAASQHVAVDTTDVAAAVALLDRALADDESRGTAPGDAPGNGETHPGTLREWRVRLIDMSGAAATAPRG